MGYKSNRRSFIKSSAQLALGYNILTSLACSPKKEVLTMDVDSNEPLFFKISLAQWSLHRSIENGTVDVLDFPSIAKNQFGINAVEYVNGFYKDHATNAAFWKEANIRAKDAGIDNLLVMIDDEGDLGHLDAGARLKSVENHYKWVDAAHLLGCHSIRVNAFGEGSRDEVGKAMADALRQLCAYSSDRNINVLIENHGLYSSDAQWVANIIKQVDFSNCGTLPDFGNFCLSQKWGSTQDGSCQEVYDRYKGVREMMPYAKGVSAKSYAFDADGQEKTIDYAKMLDIVKKAGFTGYIGIEYEGSDLSEMDGIQATKDLLISAAGSL